MTQNIYVLILGTLLVVGSVLSVDPCFNQLHPDGGLYANCMRPQNCTSGLIVPGFLCDSYSIGHVCCFQEEFPGRELRGAWIATVENIDFPISQNSSVSEQQAEIRLLIEKLSAARINSVYFQVRPVGDALYQSDIEPWSKYLTGEQGSAPQPIWDPLAYMISICHELNMDVHAWINPYRANMRPDCVGLSTNHVAVQHRDFAYPYGNYLWMDPGAEVVQNRTYAVCLDLVQRYDIASIHMDDYFYPYPVEGQAFPDDATYSNYLNDGGNLSVSDWRRENVNQLVQKIATGIKEIRPSVALTMAPFGIYRAGHPEGHPSPPIIGFDPYIFLYCDAKLWLQEGWIDELQPQLYWKIDPPAQSYPVLLDWWLEQNTERIHINAGLALYKVFSDGWDFDEIKRQVEISRVKENRIRGSWGNIHFSAKYLRDNVDGIADYFRDVIYPMVAFTPRMISNSSAV